MPQKRFFAYNGGAIINEFSNLVLVLRITKDRGIYV
jgi:hypothetical protein